MMKNLTPLGPRGGRMSRVVQNFKRLKFTPDLVNYYSFGQKHSKNTKILKIEQHLDMPITVQNFST